MNERELRTITLEIGNKEVGKYYSKEVTVPYPPTPAEEKALYKEFLDEVMKGE